MHVCSIVSLETGSPCYSERGTSFIEVLTRVMSHFLDCTRLKYHNLELTTSSTIHNIFVCVNCQDVPAVRSRHVARDQQQIV